MKTDDSYFKRWLKAAGVRALKTAAQSAVAAVGTTAVITGVDWAVVAGTAAMAAVLSLLTSVAGLPEVDEDGDGVPDDMEPAHQDTSQDTSRDGQDASR